MKITSITLPPPAGLDRPEPLRHDLRRYLDGDWISHPLYVGSATNPAYCGHINAAVEARERKVDELVADGRYGDAVMLYEKPYRMEVLERYGDRMGDAMFWTTFADVWLASENLWQYQEAIQRIINGNRPRREAMMTPEEQQALEAMPDPLTVYRGFAIKKAKEGWSWTTDRSQAEWFARRFADAQGRCFVAEGTVSKRDVVAYFTGRNESEIVAAPESVTITNTCSIRVT